MCLPTPPSWLEVRSLVLNPNPCGTFSWPTCKSPFTPFLPIASLFQSSKLLRESSASLLHLSFQIPKLCGKASPKATWSLLAWLPHPGFKSQCQSSSASPFPTPPTVGYTCQHSHIFPAFLGCHSKSEQAWPHGMEPIFAKLSFRHCNQGELPPSYILGGSHSRLPGSKHSHSYLTYP